MFALPVVPRRLAFIWWGCCGLCLDINQPSLPIPFYSVLVSISVFMSFSTVFHSINSSDNSLLSHSVLPVLFCLTGPFSYNTSLCESPRAHLHVVGMLGFVFWHKPIELAHSFLFRSCVYFCLYGPFNCISLHKFSRQLSAFSLCSSGLSSALFVFSTIYLFLKVSFSPDIILSAWLGSKHQIIN